MVSLICTLKDHRDNVNWCAFSPTLLATCSADKTLRIYNTRDFSRVLYSPLSGHGYGVHCCCFSAYVVWSTDTGEREAVLEYPGRNPVRVCAFSPGSSHLVSGTSDGTLWLWDFPTKTLVFLNDYLSTMFVTGSTYGDLRLWDLDMNQLHAEKNTHNLGVVVLLVSGLLFKMYLSVLPPMILCCRYMTACVFSPSTPLIARGSMDKTALVENVKANNIDGAERVSLTKETLASELNIESVGLRSKVLRKLGELKAGCVCTGVPDEFLCPITRELMKDPVIAAGGTRPHGNLSFCLVVPF
uniref:WD repeat, SAM and U-box domain-containing protein 1 n=1 Tax=Hucho hucho TaxID=62062 RepID=A0A4W5RSB9_9TELE